MIHRWQEARVILEELLDLAPEDQSERLTALAEQDAELAEIVRGLLAVDRKEAPELPSLTTPDSRRHVGRFQLRHRMATGRHGSVWSAARSDGAFDQEVAIKLIDLESMAKELGGDPAGAPGHERRALARIDSPHVVRLIDAGELDEATEWLALEFLDAEPLDAYCQRRRLGLEARVELMEQVARGIEACHAASVLHLDLSPSNVLVASGVRAKIIDFGSSRRSASVGDLQPGGHARVSPGGFTPAYASPEQFRSAEDAAVLDERADVWSLGALLHGLLVGRLPIDVARVPPAEARRRKLHEDPLSLRRTLASMNGDELEAVASERGTTGRSLARELRSSGLEAVVLAALRRDPGERTSSAREFREDLERWRRGEPVQARRETLTQRATRLARRRPRAAAAVLAVAGSLAIGAGALYWASLQARRATDRATQLRALESGQIDAARRTSETLVRELYQAISPLANTHDQVGRLLDAGIEVARSAQDPHLSMWLGDALVKRALHGIETARWSPEIEHECLRACDRALGLVAPMLESDPVRFEPARVALEATQLKSLSYFNLCDDDACREAMADVKARLARLAAAVDDPFAALQIRSMQIRANTVENFYGEAWGQLERVLANDRASIELFEAFAVSPMHLDIGLRSQRDFIHVRERYLTFLSLDPDGDGGDWLPEAIDHAEALFQLVDQKPTVELLISRAANAAMTLSTWLHRLGRDAEADACLKRALDRARAPGRDRRETALEILAQLEASLGLEATSVMDDEVHPVAAADLLIARARHALARSETLEAARLAARASAIYDGSSRACPAYAATRLARAEIEAVQGEVEWLQAAGRPGPERRASAERAERRLANALELFEAVGGDALHRTSVQPKRARVEARLAECRALLEER
ncbi:Serine/threonine-protein kinase PknB [Planctomycetes bacterium Poly30]|uniref:Serine/threonine-protein kinase PknB n=1 Tax=Saltatorellus ferox TaxID=2528018 RepID=A0A518ETD7_9BACT|nr:Serine/threonine-protein kinase PknB [Planctomycetes bacterium Poly30]